MKKSISLMALLSIMSLVLANFALGATSDTGQTTASVTINTFIDITLGVCNGGTATTLSYGGIDPGASDVAPVNCHSSTVGDTTITIESTTNKPVDVSIKGTDYAGPGAQVIAVSQTEYDNNEAHSSSTALTSESVVVFSEVGGVGSAVDKEFYFQLDIPSSFLTAGTYESTYTFDAS